VRQLLENENVAFDGKFAKFPATTSLPRPTQEPRPPFWVAALATESSFEWAGRMGHSIMAIPLGTDAMKNLIDTYREARRKAGHPGPGRVMLAFHMFCNESKDEAVRLARAPLTDYLKSLVDAASDWTTGSSSADYPGYDKIIAKLAADTIESQMESGSAWIGSPASIADQISEYIGKVGPFEIASLQVNFGDIPYDRAKTSMALFAQEVMPKFADRALAAQGA
jgi:alkanesulfonate monooxygenase SsuD/methylene tetrahydromethanopterin reductase-like flavin-dependent oxidoreductase (luciferase family)